MLRIVGERECARPIIPVFGYLSVTTCVTPVRSTVERRFESYSGSFFSAMKTEYVVVAEQAPPLGPAYLIILYPAAYKLSTCFDHHSILYRI